MLKKKRFKEKIGEKTIIVGLSGAAVLLALSEAFSKFFLTFPDMRTGIGKVLRDIERHPSRSIRDYFEELKETTNFNLYRTIRRLEEKGLVDRSIKNCKLTLDGQKIVDSIKNKITYKENWDNKWRLIAFDIPEKRREARDWLRSILKGYEYKPLQKSVFIGKYALPEGIYKEINNRRLTRQVRLLTVGDMDISEGEF